MKKVFGLALVLLMFFGCIQNAEENENNITGEVVVSSEVCDLEENTCSLNEQQFSLNNEGVEEMGEEKELIVANGDLIKVDYKGTFENGEEFDSSAGKAPLEFIVGAGQMIKGFDAAVVGMKVNQEKTITLKPEEAYGEWKEENIREIPLEQLKAGGLANVEEGMTVYANGMPVKVVKVNQDTNTVSMDFNHPMAGKTLVFWIKVVEIAK